MGLVKFCVCPSFPFDIAGGMWNVIVLISDHCLSIYLENRQHQNYLATFNGEI